MCDEFNLEKARKTFFAIRAMIQAIGPTKRTGCDEIDNLVDKIYTYIIDAEIMIDKKMETYGIDVDKLYQEWKEQA